MERRPFVGAASAAALGTALPENECGDVLDAENGVEQPALEGLLRGSPTD